MFNNKKVLILGFARSGYDCAKLLVNRKNEVIITDNKEKEKLDIKKIEELENLGVKFILGNSDISILDDTYDYLIKSPGVPIKHPFVLRANELNIEVVNEVEVAYLLLPKDITLISITGTNGKTTTTSLTYEIIKNAYPEKTHLVGNIGIPFTGLINDIKIGDIIVSEISCQQLANLEKFKPNIAVMTNLFPAHIDFFGDFTTYKQVKAKLFKNQTKDDIAILNLENSDVLEETKNINSKKLYFSSKQKSDIYLKNNKIYYKDEEILDTSIMKIKGIHNIENVMCATIVAKELNVSNEIIKKVVENFIGVEHRLEFSGKVNGVKYYNDTEATNIKCTQIALSSFDEPIILILGGLERGQDFNELRDYMKNVKAIIGIGECRERVKEFGNSLNIDTYIFEHLKEGFQKCVEVSTDGDVVLLSPASASWDQYKQCEDRGDEFKKYVKEID
ncbi:MAG: UDP-N-acetylmuramoyl-L-alanine--D-glutamate ligase [Bacilli bacterium]